MSFEKTYLFEGMDQEFIAKVSGALVEETFEEGSFIFRQGDPATSLYFLMKGRVRVTVGAHGSVTKILSRPGDAFGWSSLVLKGRVRVTVGAHGSVTKILSRPGDAFGWSSLVGRGTYTASTRCLDATRVKKVSAHKMNRLLEKDPSAGLLFYRRLARFIRERLIDSYRILLTYDGEKKPHSYG
jgi:CRP-like cAMP-binding protein